MLAAKNSSERMPALAGGGDQRWDNGDARDELV
jgi:hypothetical protein